MAIIQGHIQDAVKPQLWFDANSTFLLLKGEKVYLEENQNNYKLGDGITDLGSLPFLGTQTLDQVATNGNAIYGSNGTDELFKVDKVLNEVRIESPDGNGILVNDTGASMASNTGGFNSVENDKTYVEDNTKIELNSPIVYVNGDLNLPNEQIGALLYVDSSNNAASSLLTISNVEVKTNKGVSNGYVGLSGFSIAFKNLANTFISLINNSNTAIRTYLFPDKDGTVAMTSDIATAITGVEYQSNKATDFSTINNTLYPTVQAVQNYVVNAVAGLLDYRGGYDASTNFFPATGGSGIAGAILKGDFWFCTVVGMLGGVKIKVGDMIIASVDAPAQISSNWDLIGIELGYTPANIAGDTFTGNIFATNLSGTNTGDETTATIKTKLGAATTSSDGYLTATDWNTFNNKVSPTSTNTLTNKRITLRTIAVASSSTPTINTDNTDVANITALATAITSMTTNLSGSPLDKDMLQIDITDNGTARAITWGASFASTSNFTLPSTTVISTLLSILVQWNSVTSKWECKGVA